VLATDTDEEALGKLADVIASDRLIVKAGDVTSEREYGAFADLVRGSCLLLLNRIWMSAMTRTRATPDNVPTPLMGEYCAQRADAELIVTDYDAASKYPSC